MLRKIEILGAEVVCDFLKDSFLFDTNLVTPGLNEVRCFITKAGKTVDQANFHTDGRLIQDDRILETITFVARVYGNGVIDEFDLKSLLEFGSFQLDIDENQEDKDNLLRWSGGTDIRTVTDPAGFGFLDHAFVGDGTHANVRVYAKHKMIPGGKTTDVLVRWPRAGGSANVINRELQIAAYGYELKPRAKVR
jgi:hypothetical protein